MGRKAATIDDPSARAAALRDGVRAIAVDESRRQRWGGDVDDVLAMDIGLNADGLESWIASGAAKTADLASAPAAA